MFSPQNDKITKVAHFGEWADEGSAKAPKIAALNVLWEAVECAQDVDCRTGAVFDAIDFLGRTLRKKHPLNSFRAALDEPDPGQRIRKLRDAHFRIARELGLYSGKI